MSVSLSVSWYNSIVSVTQDISETRGKPAPQGISGTAGQYLMYAT